MQRQWLMSHFGVAALCFSQETLALKDHATGGRDDRPCIVARWLKGQGQEQRGVAAVTSCLHERFCCLLQEPRHSW